jgi:signal transduction histidine kinase
MIRVTSLTNRIFLACTLLATLSLGFAFYFVNLRATREAEKSLERELTLAASLVDQQRRSLTDQYTTIARLVADSPKLKAAVETVDPPTVQQLADDYLKVDDPTNPIGKFVPALFVVSDRQGRRLAGAGDGTTAIDPADGQGSIEEFSRFVSHDRGILQAVSVPIFLTGETPDIFGRLTVGFFLDDALASRLREVTGSEIAFGLDGQVRAGSLPESANAALAAAMNATGITRVKFDNGEEFLAMARPIQPDARMHNPPAHPVVLTLRSRTERLQFLTNIRNGLVGALILTVLLATILSYAVARTMTRPLTAVTGAMRHVAATGDLTRKVTLRSHAWDDEDARLLAASFNTLTESISRFQHEATQKDRLSSLGRLSTVVAHEIRNPLMIISATLATLRRRKLTDGELREAIADIDGETHRLNRLVTEVLDFAKPIRYEWSTADVNEICRSSVAAAWTGASPDGVQLDFDSTLPRVTTDPERLRTALVNILANARHAVEAVASAPAGGPGVAVAESPAVTVRTERRDDGIAVIIRDQGTGIAADDMAHIFDPYFTTRRAGTGLGLPISRNIVEGLGGAIRVHSIPGAGTEIAIELPQTAPGATA